MAQWRTWQIMCAALALVVIGSGARIAALAVVLAIPVGTYAQHAGHGAPSPYADQAASGIKSLSERDIAELRQGGGWGLAKSAELNGMPGPAHLLELEDEIPLTAAQVRAVAVVFEAMRVAAIAEGERLIARERVLEEAFRERSVTPDSLRRMLAAIEESRSALRYIHLAAHLRMPALLSDEQIARYNALRGYGETSATMAPEKRH